jgi:galactitol-specific phosphotransferase system IIB component
MVELSIKKIKAYNKILDVICTSTTTHHKDVSYILIERFANLFQDDSLSEQLLEIADSELRELV